MIPWQHSHHDSRKEEQPREQPSRHKGDVSLLEEALLSLHVKTQVGLKCHVPSEGSFETRQSEDLQKWMTL